MPRIVDHDARRREIAAALWRVVRRDGVAAISVRAVAAEAGTSPSALRHYFGTQEELAVFSLQAVVDGVRSRLSTLLTGRTGREAALTILEQYLPLDAERRAETAVYLAFLGRTDHSGRLADVRLRADADSRAGVTVAVEHLRDAGLLHPRRGVGATVCQLYPMLDGLALHGTLWPRRYPAAHLRTVLHGWVDDLREP